MIKPSVTLFFIGLPIIGISVGTIFAHQHNFPYSAFIPNLIGLFIGIVLVFLIRLTDRVSNLLMLGAIAALIVMTSTLFLQGVNGVHRWIPLGPINLNASMAFAPVIIAAIHRSFQLQKPLLWVLLIWTLVLHIIQPDGGQAFAFSAAIIFLMVNSLMPAKIKILATLISLAGAGMAWMKADTLEAIPHVEKILHLIGSTGVVGIVIATISIIVLLLPFVWTAQKNISPRPLAIAFAVYFIGQFIITEFGNFPVPIIGAGAAPVIGWYLALGSLLQLCKVERDYDFKIKS